MSFSIQTNVNSLVAQENLRVNGEFQNRTIQRLTSGYRINSSGDDAAGLAVANKFRSDVSELTQGVRNANDGVSQLQIADGGMNNISKMLDRMKTLATQSASNTFTGDRSTLNAEFQQLIGEITRQATNVGLNTGGIYNKAISTYIGGSGNAGSNAMITTDLSAAAVDATALNLSTASVLGGGNTIGTIDLNSTTAFKDPTHKFMVGGSATFTFNMMASDGSATTQAITLNGGTAGLTKQEILTNLNTQLQPYGISATFAEQVAGDGKSTLAFAGSKNFSVVASAVTAGTDPIVAVTNTTRNNALYRVAFGAKGAASAGEQYAVTTADGHAFVVDVGTLTDNATTIAAFNAAGKAFGVTMVNDVTGTGMLLASSQTFTLTKTNAGGGTDLTYGALLNPTAGTSDTGSALAAIQAISAAVTKLGQAQGVVGAGQNKLQYAIALAQSQISNFSAAESRIRDADVAAEAANLTKAQVLQQASMAAMAQANSAPQAVLSLLRG